MDMNSELMDCIREACRSEQLYGFRFIGMTARNPTNWHRGDAYLEFERMNNDNTRDTIYIEPFGEGVCKVSATIYDDGLEWDESCNDVIVKGERAKDLENAVYDALCEAEYKMRKYIDKYGE